MSSTLISKSSAPCSIAPTLRRQAPCSFLLSLACAATLLAACGSRSLLPLQPDSGPLADVSPKINDKGPLLTDAARPPSDSAPGNPCDPMEAAPPPSPGCDDPTPLGWAWDGQGCQAIRCGCAGRDCAALYASEALCYQERAPACLPAPDCLAHDYEQCTEQRGCQEVYFGGGCIDLDVCAPDDPHLGGLVCWEREIACLPADHPCNVLGRGECDGVCFWWEQESEDKCFGGSNATDCCITERYGYCAPLPAADACLPQEVGGCPLPCANTVGYFWDGAFCQPIICCCNGPDCEQTYPTAESCLAAHRSCTDNACALATGFCITSDDAQLRCPEGYGSDWLATASDPGACGLGVCCTPCLDPSDPRVEYVSLDPGECAALDFDCPDNETQRFDNECGCGCRWQ